MTTNEGGIIDEEYAVLYARDRTETTSTVWMGLTAGCAVCHDHKFDPMRQREFYEMSAFFNNTTQPVRDGNVKDTPPVVVVPRQADRKRWNELQSLVTEASGRKWKPGKKAARAEFDTWLATATPRRVCRAGPRRGPAPARSVWTKAAAEGDGSRGRQVAKDAAGRDGPVASGPRCPAGGEDLEPGRGRRSPTPATSRPTRLSPPRRGSSCRPTTATGRSSREWTTSTTIAAGISGSRDAASARTSFTSGATTR